MSLFQPVSPQQLAANFRGEEGSRNPGQPAMMPQAGMLGQMPQEGAPAQFPQEGAPAEFPQEGRPALFPGEAAPEYSYIGDPIVDKYIHSFIGTA